MDGFEGWVNCGDAGVEMVIEGSFFERIVLIRIEVRIVLDIERLFCDIPIL